MCLIDKPKDVANILQLYQTGPQAGTTFGLLCTVWTLQITLAMFEQYIYTHTHITFQKDWCVNPLS